MSAFSLALRHALRDMRGGARHLWLLLLCLALGVAVMGCIGSVIAAMHAGIDRDARAILGGDVEVRQIYQDLPQDAQSWLASHSTSLSRVITMRAMAELDTPLPLREGAGGGVASASYGASKDTPLPNPPPQGGRESTRTLVEMKAVDKAYPLLGELSFRSKQGELFNTPEKNLYGAYVDQSLLDALGIKPGDIFRIGSITLQAIAILEGEPDRSLGGLTLGPRVMVTPEAIRATGLITYGSMVNYHYRMTLPPGMDVDGWKRSLSEAFPKAYWNMRDWRDSAPGLLSLIDRVALFFALTSVTTLVIAGIGIAGAAGIYIWSKWQTIATFKCLGASAAHVRLVYLLELILVSSLAIAAGLLIALAGEWIVLHFFGELLPVRGEGGLYLKPLLISGLLGFCTLVMFSLLPLHQTLEIRPAALFRGYAQEKNRSWPKLGRSEWLALGMLAAVMMLLAMAFTEAVKIPLAFAFGLGATTVLLLAISAGLKKMAWRKAHERSRSLTLSMALSGLARPGSETTSMVVALGIGMTLLVALALVGGNLRAQLEEGLPEHAPAFFLIDIQPSEREALLEKVKALPGVTRVTDLPMVRGAIYKLNGKTLAEADVAENARWALRGDRGLTWSEALPAGSSLTQGRWWAKDYKGPPLLSFDANLARGMGLKIGDTVTFTALDKEVTATIANLRDIPWGTLEMNFASIFSPGALDGLPATYLATVYTPPDSEKAVQLLMAREYPSVGVVHVRDALGKISQTLARISHAVLAVASVTILCGVLVMASAIQASLAKRMYDTVMLKVLGVTRKRILLIYLTEFAIIAGAVALVALIIGSLAAWGVMQLMIFSQFELKPAIMLATLAGSLLVAIGLGLIATRAALSVRPLSLLRNE